MYLCMSTYIFIYDTFIFYYDIYKDSYKDVSMTTYFCNVK